MEEWTRNAWMSPDIILEGAFHLADYTEDMHTLGFASSCTLSEVFCKMSFRVCHLTDLSKTDQWSSMVLVWMPVSGFLISSIIHVLQLCNGRVGFPAIQENR